ncbi:MAG: SDR family NAD(P)-dependent oxidoreductase [Dehalococcoidia bacterium]|nr:SDR family NAD(P)-dependent oxidoreductase [Dehalococcoidia bacterium]
MATASALRGTHVLLTGATTPLARALAVALAEAGATVSVTTARTDLAEEVAANSILNETWSAGSQGRAYTVDLLSGASVDVTFAAIEREVAPVDVLANVVGPSVEAAGSVDTVSWAAAERLAVRGGGRIVNVLPPDASAEARALVLALTRGLDAAWGARGVVVCTLAIEAGASLDARAAIVALAAGAGDAPPGEPVAGRLA